MFLSIFYLESSGFLVSGKMSGWTLGWWNFYHRNLTVLDPVAQSYLRLSGNFCNCSLFSGRCFRTVIMFRILFNPPSTDLSIITTRKIFRNTGNGCRNSHLILSFFMQLGPVSLDPMKNTFTSIKHKIAKPESLPVTTRWPRSLRTLGSRFLWLLHFASVCEQTSRGFVKRKARGETKCSIVLHPRTDRPPSCCLGYTILLLPINLGDGFINDLVVNIKLTINF